MKNIIISELDRLLKNKKNIWLAIVGILVYIAFGVFVLWGGVGFYDPETHVKLNSLNMAPFILRDFHMFLLFVFSSMLFIESFNYDNTSGAYRLYLVRGYRKKDYLVGKILAMSFIMAIFMIIIWIIGSLFGYFICDTVETTRFFNINKEFNLVGSLIYSFKFYSIEYLIILAYLGLTSIISTISKNTVIAYLLSVGTAIGLIYINDIFEFFFVSSQTIFDVLSKSNNSFFITSVIIIIGTILSSIFVFEKKDYLN